MSAFFLVMCTTQQPIIPLHVASVNMEIIFAFSSNFTLKRKAATGLFHGGGVWVGSDTEW